MDKSAQPPPYNEIFPTAPPDEGSSVYQQIYPNVPQQNIYPQPGYQQPLMHPQPIQTTQPVRTNVIVINQQVIFGENPIAMTCPHCQQQILTKVDYESNMINHGAALILCIFGLCCCACIPYCIDSIKDVTHKCSKCGKFLGKYRRGRV